MVIRSQLGTQNVGGQECDSETNATFAEALVEVQSLLECVFSAADNYTFENEDEDKAFDDLGWYNESAFDALDQGNCSAL